MDSKKIVADWFEKWESGAYNKLPITSDFIHRSPFGIIEGKEEYLRVVNANQDKFLGYVFAIEDAMYDTDKACIRYKAVQGDFSLDVSEWHYIENGLIREVVAYYHIGEIREDRSLN